MKLLNLYLLKILIIFNYSSLNSVVYGATKLSDAKPIIEGFSLLNPVVQAVIIIAITIGFSIYMKYKVTSIKAMSDTHTNEHTEILEIQQEIKQTLIEVKGASQHRPCVEHRDSKEEWEYRKTIEDAIPQFNIKLDSLILELAKLKVGTHEDIEEMTQALKLLIEKVKGLLNGLS